MRRWLPLLLLTAAVLAVTLLVRGRAGSALRVQEAHPPLPDGARPIAGLVVARPFALAEPYATEWRADRPRVASGWLVVLDVDPELVIPRNEREPVLYAGDTTVERVNVGHETGRVIGVVPSLDGPAASGGLDGVPFWFGSPALPEEVGPARIRAERAAARAAGIGPPTSDELASALERGGQPAVFADRAALRRAAAALVLRWSPTERDLAEGILAPPPERAR